MRLASARSLGIAFYRRTNLLIRCWQIRRPALVIIALIAAFPASADKYAAVVVDYQTGRVLHAVDPDQQLYPASLTKMMTLYMAFEALKQRRASLAMALPVSDHAAAMAPSRLNLRPGAAIRMEDAILALVTKSANDAAVAIAEGLGGTEANFARMMTAKAHALGMHRSHFANASGLPHPAQISTARDMATLGQALVRDFPAYYPYFNTRTFTYNNQIISNHNRILASYDGADGIKTGFINASGFNLVASAKRNGRRLVAAVFGGKTAAWRDAHMRQLLDAGFAASADLRDNSPASSRAPVPLTKDPTEPALHRVTATLPAADPAMSPPSWAIQIGAFAANRRAHSAAQEALRTVPSISHGKISVAASQTRANGVPPVYRARISGLAQAQARDACQTLMQRNKPCLTVPPGAEPN